MQRFVGVSFALSTCTYDNKSRKKLHRVIRGRKRQEIIDGKELQRELAKKVQGKQSMCLKTTKQRPQRITICH